MEAQSLDVAAPRDPVPSTGATPGVFQRLDLCPRAPYPASWYVRRILWGIVWLFLFRPSPNRLDKFRILLLRLFGAKIPMTAVIQSTCRVRHPWILTMGKNACLGDHVEIYNLGPVTIGDHSVISQEAYICAGTHDYTQPNLPLLRPTIEIGGGVWICARAFVGPGVKIGDNALVGACAVVTKDVPPNVIVAGNPAKVIRTRPMPGFNQPA